MSDLIRAVQQNTDVVRATVVTAHHQLEGELHCPRTGRGDRLLTNLLNAQERRFIVLTNVTIINRSTGHADPETCPVLQVNMEAIEFIRPDFNQGEVFLGDQD